MLKTNVGTLFPYDLAPLSESFGICNMEVVLLGADDTRATVDTVAQGEAFVCSAETAFSFCVHLTLPPNWCLLGYIHNTDENSWCHGLPLSTDTAITVLPGGHSEFMFAAGSRLTLLMMPLPWLCEKFSEFDPRPAAAPSRPHAVFRLTNPLAAQRLRTLYQEARQQLTQPPSTCDMERSATRPDINVAALLEAHIVASLSVTADDLPGCSRARRRHYMAVQRTDQFIRANLHTDIYINEMCDAAKVSERTLRYAFDDMLGISPNRYLSMLRLCTARRSLAASDVSRRSVKSVALSCGLWDLSRFANSYRRVFGEPPYATLMRNSCAESLQMY